jgi:hypothetical protein
LTSGHAGRPPSCQRTNINTMASRASMRALVGPGFFSFLTGVVEAQINVAPGAIWRSADRKAGKPALYSASEWSHPCMPLWNCTTRNCNPRLEFRKRNQLLRQPGIPYADGTCHQIQISHSLEVSRYLREVIAGDGVTHQEHARQGCVGMLGPHLPSPLSSGLYCATSG